ncbi:MAG: energy-coupling factor transporter transmembrane component T [Candidatus Neomarinimicrobiota bacterium]
MKQGPNTLSWLVLLVAFLILIFRSVTLLQYIWLVMALLVTLTFQRVPVRSIWSRLRPLLIFLPLMFVFYLLLSLILADVSFRETAWTVLVSSSRILLMVLGVAIFLEVTSPMAILDSLRTVWRALGISFRPIEDFFQLLYLSLRFFPMLREEVHSISNLRKALDLPTDGNRLRRIKQMAIYLPGLISNCLHRADNLAVAMETRRYGLILPRGLAHPVRFHLADAALPVILFLLIAGHIALDQL